MSGFSRMVIAVCDGYREEGVAGVSGTSIRIMPSCRDVMQLAVAAAADVQVGARRVAPLVALDQLPQRHVRAVAARVPHVQLHLFDRRHRLRNPIVGLLHRGEIGGEQPAALDVAEDELAAQRGDPAVVGEAAA